MVIRRTDHNWKFENGMEGHISKCIFDTAYNAPGWHGVNELKLKLSKYSKFCNGEAQQDSFECLLLLMDIVDKGFLPCFTGNFIQGFSIWTLSFVLEKYIVRDVCGLRSASFESTAVLYITPTSIAPMQKLIMEDHKQKLWLCLIIF